MTRLKKLLTAMFVLPAWLAGATVYAQECQTREALVAQIEQHRDMLPANKELTAAETVKAATSGIIEDPPAAADIDQGLMTLRADGAVILSIWLKDGTCGYVLVPPLGVETLLRAIAGTDS